MFEPIADAPPAPCDLAPLAMLHHENAAITAASLPYVAESIGEFSADRDEQRRTATSAKTYPGAQRVPFPPRAALPLPPVSLADALARRRTVRAMTDAPLSFAALAALLDHAAGVTASLAAADEPELVQPLRAWPSGGALYPVELYLAAFACGSLATALHHHQPIDRCLETIAPLPPRAEWDRLLLTLDGRLPGAALLILTIRWRRPLTKYGERGYRVALLDAGHLAQNLLLSATALDLAACPLAGFLDDELAAALGLDRREESPVYAIALGHAADVARTP